MKKTVLAVAMLLLASSSFAQIFGGDGFGRRKSNPDNPPDEPRKEDASHGSDPIGTATLLLLTMGGAYAGYKIKVNSKSEDKQ
ncbi:MAG: hypothetical protein J6P44_09845 [Bacteroidales bacterium]|nr:hypothetical protein [Bacteroidales bacterium]